MTPAAAKLLMCVCAGSTGAVMVPAVHKARTLMKPRPAAHRIAAAPLETMRGLPCIPATASASGLIGDGAGLAPISDFTEVTAVPVPQDERAGGRSHAPATGPDGGFGHGGGLIAAPGLPAVPGPGAIVPTPGTSPAPEPAGWAMMITGFGLLGGVLRWRRQVAV